MLSREGKVRLDVLCDVKGGVPVLEGEQVIKVPKDQRNGNVCRRALHTCGWRDTWGAKHGKQGGEGVVLEDDRSSRRGQA